ncbi:MAG: helix-turn-helix transcriptional regulator [Firmicutes bacterium]|nr:helix-turn-helix transcriptional regulator [Bacillota bacterium]
MPHELYTFRAQVIRALAHPIRLQIIDLLSPDEERCVCELVEALGCDQPTVSKHLGVLKSAGLVTARKEGTKTFYRIRTPCVKEFLGCIDRVLKEDLKARNKELAGIETL